MTLNQQCTEPNTYYNNYVFQCTTCKQEFTYDSFLQRCVCSGKRLYDFQGGCTPWLTPQEAVASRDGLKKMTCPQAINETTKDCKCDFNEALVETDELGFKMEIKQCISFTSTPLSATSPIYPEVVCRGGQTAVNGVCTCVSTDKDLITESQGICIPNSQLISTVNTLFTKKIRVNYNNIENINNFNELDTLELDSNLIDFYYDKAARDCYYRVSLEACQVIANLCVLRHYDETTPECQLYNHINWNSGFESVDETNFPGWKKNMPWLYYKTSATTNANATAIIMNPDRITFEVSFDPKVTINVNRLEFYMAKFYMNGTLYNFTQVNKEFILCSNKFTDETNYRTFGQTIVNQCDINLEQYITRNYEMFFYEVFLNDTITATNNLIDVPILNRNIPANGNNTQMGDWILTRRFFLIDNLLSTTNYADAKVNATLVQYAKRVKFIIQLQHKPNDPKKSLIYVPYIEIFHRTRRASDLPTNARGNVQFISEYSMNIDKFMNVCLALIITIAVISLLAALAQMYTWIKVNPSDLYLRKYALAVLLNFLFKLFRFFGFLTFWYIWIITAYWYIFFKLQFRVYLLLPPLETYDLYYKKFDIVFGIGFASYTLYIFYKIYLQSSYDIFFIDWEQDKEMLEKSLEKRGLHSTYYRYRGAWRQLQVINQFFELQKRRNVSFYFCIIWVILMYYRVDWWYKNQHVPRVINIEHAPENFILRHFVTSFIILICGISQFIIMRLAQFWIPLKTVEFLDLCSVSNISVFILTDYLRGYYIHGKSPVGKADANLDELLQFLERESKGKMRERGISDGETADLQSFEMFISYSMRTVYDGLHCIQVESSLLTQGKKVDSLNTKSKLGPLFKQLPDGVNPQNVNYFSNYMNNQLKNKIETIILNPRQYVFDKMAYDENICNKMVAFVVGYPPSLGLMSGRSKDITMFKDPRNNFDEVLFFGMEFEWFIFEVFMFQMWMRVLNNMEIAFFLTFVCEKIISIVRNILVERNIGKKAGVDTRFIS